MCVKTMKYKSIMFVKHVQILCKDAKLVQQQLFVQNVLMVQRLIKWINVSVQMDSTLMEPVNN